MTHCKNCGGHFTEREMLHRIPPRYAWKLSQSGARAANENAANGDTRLCPECGCAALR